MMVDRLKEIKAELADAIVHVQMVRILPLALMKSTNNDKIEEDLRKLRIKLCFKNQDLEKMANLLLEEPNQRDL